MTLPNIVALQQEIMSAYEQLKAGGRVDFHGIDFHIELDARTGQRFINADKALLHFVAVNRLGRPGDKAPFEGGSFDWEIAEGVAGKVHFIIKSYTDQATVERLQAQYRSFLVSGHRGDIPYDFR